MPKLNHYRKELLSNPVLVSGQRVPFQPLAGNRGVIALDEEKPEDVVFITALSDFAARRKFGVVKITAEEYEGLKKKVLTSPQSSKRKGEKLRVMQPLLKPKQSPAKDAPAVNLSPIKESTPNVPPAQVLQQAKQNPDGTPGTPVNIAVGASSPAFVPRTAPKPEIVATGEVEMSGPKDGGKK